MSIETLAFLVRKSNDVVNVIRVRPWPDREMLPLFLQRRPFFLQRISSWRRIGRRRGTGRRSPKVRMRAVFEMVSNHVYILFSLLSRSWAILGRKLCYLLPLLNHVHGEYVGRVVYYLCSFWVWAASTLFIALLGVRLICKWDSAAPSLRLGREGGRARPLPLPHSTEAGPYPTTLLTFLCMAVMMATT